MGPSAYSECFTTRQHMTVQHVSQIYHIIVKKKYLHSMMDMQKPHQAGGNYITQFYCVCGEQCHIFLTSAAVCVCSGRFF